MAKKKRAPRRCNGKPAKTGGPGRTRRDAPGLFKLADEVLAAASTAVASTTTEGPTLRRFDASQLARGIEAVRAICLLLEHRQWEFASGIARQLFEQLANVEYLGAQRDRLASATSCAKFGLMQRIAQRLAEERYNADTGRPGDGAFRELLQGRLDLDFEEFKGTPRKDGSLNLKSSWSGTNVRQLTESSRNAMRGNQYELLFRVWSTQVHAAPSAMVDNLFGSDAAAGLDAGQQRGQESAQLLAVTLSSHCMAGREDSRCHPRCSAPLSAPRFQEAGPSSPHTPPGLTGMAYEALLARSRNTLGDDRRS